MGRERALGLEPQSDLDSVRAALLETREGRQAMAAAGTPPWESIPDVRDLLERARVPGSVAEGSELVTLLPLLDAAGSLDAGVLRSLDAIHLAAAQVFGDELVAVVTYDERMIAAAARLTLPIRTPR